MTGLQVPHIEPVYEKGWRKGDLDQLHTELGFHVVPVGLNKLPTVKWRHGGTDFVEVKPSDVNVQRWVRSNPTGWAVVCGGPNRLVCLDVEAAGMADASLMGERIREILGRLPDTCQRRSPSGGRHAWLQVTDRPAPAGEKLMTRGDGTDEKPCYTLLAESRGHGQYAVMLGHGRGNLPDDFAPHKVTLAELDELFELLRSVSDTRPRGRVRKLGTANNPQRGRNMRERQEPRTPMDTGDFLAEAVLDGDLSWLHLLDDGWEDVGQTAEERTLWLRPDYGKPATSVSSACGMENLGTPSLTVHSAAVLWAEAGESFSPAQVLAEARFGGNYAAALRMVERTAEALAVNGVAPVEGHILADWPTEFLKRTHTERSAWQAARQAAPGQHVDDADRFFDKREGLLIATLAEEVEKLVGPFATGPGDTLWVFRDGVYVNDGAQDVRRVVVTLCGERFRDSYLRNALQVLKARHSRVTLPSGAAYPDDRYLNLPNGLLDWRTGTLLPHDPGVPSVHRIPVAWDPNATCPLTDRFLQDLFGDDDEMIAFVEEIVAAGLYSGHPFHQRAVMLLGEGKNGKGSFLALLRLLVGDANVSEVKPQALDASRFASAQLYGKLANLAGDVAPTAFEKAERFKEVTAGDVIEAEYKYGQPFSFHPVATVVASFNEMPATVDRSEGFFRRWLVLPFPHRFVDGSEATGAPDERLRDPQAVSAVSEPSELSGFLNRAVAGLRRLHDRGDFDPPVAALLAMDKFREYGDPVVAFLKETYRSNTSEFLSRSSLNGDYGQYCDKNGVKRMSPARLHQHLPGAATAAFGFRVEPAKRNGARGFKGLDYRDDN
jgi:P4 family phage/plasmid primase-like protien